MPSWLPPLYGSRKHSNMSKGESGGGKEEEQAPIRMDGERDEERDDAVQVPSKSKVTSGQSGAGFAGEAAPASKRSGQDEEDDEENPHASKEMEKKAASARADPKKKVRMRPDICDSCDGGTL